MDQIAFVYLGIPVYWSGIISALGVVAAVLMTLALRARQGRGMGGAAVFCLLALVLGFFCARFVHWYCFYRQYSSLSQAFSDYSVGAFALPGAFFGALLAALILRAFGAVRDLGALLDCAAPAAALGIAVGRFGFLFNSLDRGKTVFTDPRFQGLPWSTAVESAGGVQWHAAVFFWEALAAFAVFIALILVIFLARGRLRSGEVFWFFLVLYGAAEIWLDSMRYDSCYLRSNGFVSLVQIIGALSCLAALIVFSVRSIRRDGMRAGLIVCWTLWLLSLGLAGFMEYYVQRHADKFLLCYALMAAGLSVTVFCTLRCRRAPRRRGLH